MAYTTRIARLLATLTVSVLMALSLTATIFAQSNKATLSGAVTDAQGAVVTDADVTIRNIATGATRQIKTNADGFFEAPLLDIGAYEVTVTRQGFQTVKRENITLQTGTETTVDVQLPAGEVTSQVTVTAEAPLVQTETSERGTIVTGREVTELPLSGRNFTQLATLTPGVARSSNAGGAGGTGPDARSFNNGDPRAGNGGPGASNAQGSTESSRFSRSGGAGLIVNGQRPTNNNFSLDGVDNNEPQFGTIGVFPNPDSIAEFKISTSIPPAEIGRAAGAVISTTIRSGTNDFHGSLYYYGQNSALNAYHPILKRDLAAAISRNDRFLPLKATQQIHEFGGTLGGPIIKERLFFFFDYLGQRNNLPFPTRTAVPTALTRAGNFSEFDEPLLNPFTGQQFAGNIIPTSLINPVASRFINLYPLPTAASIRNPNTNNPNFFTERANKEVINNYGIKLDYKISDKNSLTGRYNDQKLFTTRANLLPGLPTAGFGAGDERGDTRQISLSDTHLFSPTLVNEFRFGFTQINIAIFNCGVNGACGTSPTFANDIGIPNSNDGTIEASGGTGLGTFGDARGGIEFTGDGGLFQVKSKNPYFADTLTIIKGNHVIKTGAEVRTRFLNTIDGGRSGFLKGNIGYAADGPSSQPIQPGQVCPVASQTSGGTRCFIDANGVPYGGTGNTQANLLLSLPAFSASRGKVFGGPFDLRTQEYGFFVQDDWKVNSSLTLNLGLRYDLFTAPTEASGRLSYYDPEQRKVVVASDKGDRIVNNDKNNFGPRIGFAYALNKEKSLVVRGGYGLLYTLDGTDYPPGIRNPPFTNSVSFNQFEQAPGRRTYFSVATGPPSVSTEVDPNALSNTGLSLYAVDKEQKTGMVHQFQVSVQYQFGRDYSIDVGYVGNRSRNLLTTNNIGRSGTAEARNAANQFLDNVLLYTNRGESSYNGLQMQLQKRLSKNFQGQISYTFSHTEDDGIGLITSLGDSRNGGRGGPINPFDLTADKGTSGLDVRHLLSASAIIDLPFGKGQRFLNNGGAVDKIFGGFQVNLIYSARSGFPFTVVCNNSIVRPNLIGDPFANVAQDRFFNAAAFNCSDSQTGLNSFTNAAGNVIRYGNLERNSITGPSIYNTDMSVFKNTRITEGIKFQIGIEFFNLFNSTKFTIPNNNAGDPGSFGRFDGAFPARVIQYRAKLIF